MADNPRIEDLRKRYHENPRRFFAPLANEYRKSGFLDRAQLLCEKHLAEPPENMNGLVVYGQTLFELGRHDEARTPFEMALRVDPENLIALRHLGDIARLAGDLETAKQWYEKVLEFDRRNDEVLDLLQQMGAGPEGGDSSAPATGASSMISVASSVSVSGGPDVGMVDLDLPADPPPPAPAPAAPAGPGRTVVINAQALAARDRVEAEAGAVTQPMDAVVLPPAAPAAPVEPAPEAARPSKRASLLDIDFDFSEMPEESAKPAVPAAPVLGAEAAEYGFADVGAETLKIETTGDVAPLGLEPTIAETPAELPPTAAAGSDFQLAEFSADVSPLAGLEATEFTSDVAAPMEGLEASSLSSMPSSVTPLEGLDRVDVTADNVESITGLGGLGLPDQEPQPAAEHAEPAAAADGVDSLGLPLLEDPSVTPPPEEPPSVGRPKPRMTKADLASLPLLADFGLEDDAEAKATPAAPTPVQEPAPAPEPARTSKATPTFVTETMAALYVQQGHFDEAIGVYRQLIAQSPGNAALHAKLAELERMQATASREPASATGPDASVDMPEFEAPAADAVEPAPAPANAALAGVSFAGVGLRGESAATPIVTPAVHGGPSAREFFGGFARRAVAPAVASVPSEPAAAEIVEAASVVEPATAVSTSGWPLDALFGAPNDVRDLHAAEALAGVGTFTGPDGGSGLDALFSGAPDASPTRKSVPRASEMLKFDQFFQTPAARASQPQDSDPAAAPGDDDLDQFQGWLKGLKQ